MIKLDFDKSGGLIPAIAQDFESGEILMQAFINEEALLETIHSGMAVYFSRSRSALWRKGERSGNVQKIKAIKVDCDLDSVIYVVEQIGGAACHTGRRSCYYHNIENGELVDNGSAQIFNPNDVY